MKPVSRSSKSFRIQLWRIYEFFISIRAACLVHFILFDLCRVHAIFRLRLIFTYAAFWTCASSLPLTPTLSYLLPCLGLLFWTQDHYSAGLRPGNISWKFCLTFLSKVCFGPGRSTRSPWSADVTSTKYRKFVFACVFCGGLYPLGTWAPRRILLGVFCFCFSLAITRHSLSLYLPYMILYHPVLSCIFTLLHIVISPVSHSCCHCFYLLRIYTLFVCLVKWLSTLFVPHLEGRVALFDPHPVTVRKKAQILSP
jgi:hypothetical protein